MSPSRKRRIVRLVARLIGADDCTAIATARARVDVVDRGLTDAAANVAHTRRTGHSPQRITRAVHTSAPISISAWLCVHTAGEVPGSERSASSHNAFSVAATFRFSRGRNTRCSTRATFVSTSGVRCP